MKQSEILEISEGKYVELTRAKNKNPDSFWETYSAFANTAPPVHLKLDNGGDLRRLNRRYNRIACKKLFDLLRCYL